MEAGILAWKHCVAKLPCDPESCSPALPVPASEFREVGRITHTAGVLSVGWGG